MKILNKEKSFGFQNQSESFSGGHEAITAPALVGLAPAKRRRTFGVRTFIQARIPLAGILGALWALGCETEPQDQDKAPETPAAQTDFEKKLPKGFPLPRIPETSSMSAERIELGRYLFYDPRLSGNQSQSCASCHEQARAFSDGKARAVGSTGQMHPRNSSSLVNVAYNATLTWANPALTELEKQILIPLFGDSPVEMGATGHKEEILARIAADPRYTAMFSAAFKPSTGAAASASSISWPNIVSALASFVRSLVSGNSAFDRFVYHNELNALSDSARRGMELFFSERLECHHCHGGFNFTESSVHKNSAFAVQRFHNTGLYNLDGKGAYPKENTGVFAITGEPADMGRFRAPTLRNVALSAPYMHDGSMATLDEVIRSYEAGGRHIETGPLAGDGRKNPFKSSFVPGFKLNEQERRDLIAFLESLSDPAFIQNPNTSDPFGGKAP